MPITDLSSKHTNLLCAILGQYFHNMPVSVFLFGSQAGTVYRPDSDLDLLIDAAPDIPLSRRAQLQEAFEESTLPFRVDVVFRTDISPEFYQRIQEHLIPLCAFKGHVC